METKQRAECLDAEADGPQEREQMWEPREERQRREGIRQSLVQLLALSLTV